MNNSTSISAADLLIAVDAGGTKTAVWLVESTPSGAANILGRGYSSGGNPLSVGFASATRAISTAVDQARGAAQATGAPASRAILSIAGAADTEVRRSLIRWAHETSLAGQVAIVSDFLPVLAVGTRDCVGVALVSGTGSSAFARAADGSTARCGGWGYLLGDEGSGFAIGRAALQHALHVLETSKTPDALARAVLTALGANSVAEITHAIYRSHDIRAKIASLAPLVLAAAEHDEPSAGGIVDTAARDLASLVVRAAQATGLAERPIELALSGSVLVNSSSLRSQLGAELATQKLDCSIHVVEEPLQGCVRLATAKFGETLVEWS